jgi:LuxR family transcriptional regulator, maltose regulon positive regulatory protein
LKGRFSAGFVLRAASTERERAQPFRCSYRLAAEPTRLPKLLARDRRTRLICGLAAVSFLGNVSVSNNPVATATHDFDQVLLEGKLSLPRLRPDTVSRGRLIEVVRTLPGCRVVGITAPAGYGKSTLLAEWASAEDRRVGFVSFDRIDDDPVRLVQLLAAAWSRINHDQSDLAADLVGSGTSVLGRATPRLAAAMRSSTAPFVLMLDDLHELQSLSCHDVLSVIVDALPQGSQLVTASRFEQPHLPRLRVSGEALEIVSADLALDATGAQKIFSAQHLNLSEEMADALIERTEGWPAGLYLAAVLSKESDGQSGVITGDDRYVADYLYREALSRLPEDSQRFLRYTAVLDQLCGPLCDAVVASPGGAERLHELEASSLFVIPLDRRREWYRYHALFREFLLGELRRRDPAIVEKLHLRAADWYEANGAPRLSVEHLLHTTERDRSVQLVTQLIGETLQTGEISTGRRWLTRLGQAGIERYPPLAVYAALEGVLCGEPTRAERWAAFLDGASFSMAPAADFASFESGRALVRAMMCAAGVEQMLSDAAFVVSQEPPWSGWRDRALCALAEAHVLAGDTDQARSCFAELCSTAVEHGQVDVLVRAEPQLGRLAMDRGDWQEGADRVDLALTMIDKKQMQDYVSSLLAYSGAARLCFHRGDLDEAHRYLLRAMRDRPLATYAWPQVAVRLRTEMAKLYLDLGHATTSRQLLREIEDIMIRRPALGTLADQVEALRAELADVSAGRGPGPLTPAELRLLPYLQTHLTLGAIAERLFVSRNTVNSQVTSIYRKLGVSSRPEAVSQATTMGLVGK